MTDTVILHVDGLATIDAALRGLSESVRKEILADALGAGGEVLRAGVASRIKDRSGLTAKDVHVEVQTVDNDVAGVAAVGASTEKTGRAYILKFLEFGTRPHAIPKATRRGRPKKRPAFGGRVFATIHHPGTHAQAPLRITIAEDGEQAVKAFADEAWKGILAALERHGGKN